MKIQMLGTGSAFAKQYLNTNALIYANGYNLLIDCGSTAMLALHQLDIPIDQINGVWITHIHADHTGGLEELAFRTKYELHHKIDLYIAASLVHILWDNCLKGGLLNERDGLVSLEDYYNVIIVEELQSVQITNELHVEPIRTQHVPGKASYSLYINHSFFYSADLQFNPELLNQLYHDRGCKLIFHDCQLEGSGAVHTTLEQLLTLPTELQKIIRLVHYSDNVTNFYGRTGDMQFLNQHEYVDF